MSGPTLYLVRASDGSGQPDYARIVEAERDDPGFAIRSFLSTFAFVDSKLTVTAERVR